MKVLHLNLYARYFDAIASGEKREEYRRCIPHWKQRIEDRDRFNVIEFTNGFRPGARRMRVECLGWHFGHWEGEKVYVLRLGRILTPPRMRENHAGAARANR